MHTVTPMVKADLTCGADSCCQETSPLTLFTELRHESSFALPVHVESFRLPLMIERQLRIRKVKDTGRFPPAFARNASVRTQWVCQGYRSRLSTRQICEDRASLQRLRGY